jgi:xanthosine utilization system XapX-like protein
MKEYIIKIAVLLPALVLVAVPAMAQPAPPATPIDGGLGILLAAGGIYGAKKLKERRQK